MQAFNETLAELDDRKNIETIFTSWIGVLLTVTTAIISTLSSTLVIWLIYISDKKLAGSVYHRILFGMSVADIIQSIAMALTTLPMPTDMIYTGFQGIVIGNRNTCNAQGYLITLGSISGMIYNSMLSVYYLCSIKFVMMDLEFRKRIEPYFHMTALVGSTVIATFLLLTNLYNPSPTAMPWCGTSVYPFWATEDGHVREIKVFHWFIMLLCLICVSTIVVSMIMIATAVRRREEPWIDISPRRDHEEGEESRSNSISNRLSLDAKIIRNQALAYSFVNLLGFALLVVFPYTRNLSGNGITPPGWQIFFLVFRPIHGFFNSCIFVYHKVHNLQCQKNIGFGQAFFLVLGGEEACERMFSNIHNLHRLSTSSSLPDRLSPYFLREHVDLSVSNSSRRTSESFARLDPLAMKQNIHNLSGFSIAEKYSSRLKTNDRGSDVFDQLDPLAMEQSSRDLSGFSASGGWSSQQKVEGVPTGTQESS